MAEKMSEKESICLERCYFSAENCRQKPDGTWDCSVSHGIARNLAATNNKQDSL